VEYYPASQLGNSLEMLENVSMGTIEMGMSVGFDVYANLDPICAVFGMPFLFDNYDHLRATMESDNDAINEVKTSMMENIDTRIMGYCYRPFRSVMTMAGEVRTPADMAGMTIRSPESKANQDWITAMGGTPVTISWSELYTSMSTGAAQGAENSITEFHAGSFQDILYCASETNHMPVTCLLTANNTWYESLTDAQREVLDKASADFNDFMWAEFEKASEKAWTEFEAAGVVVIRNDEIDVAAFREASADIYKAFVERGDFTEELYNAVRNVKY